jgi:hypothetical protein
VNDPRCETAKTVGARCGIQRIDGEVRLLFPPLVGKAVDFVRKSGDLGWRGMLVSCNRIQPLGTNDAPTLSGSVTTLMVAETNADPSGAPSVGVVKPGFGLATAWVMEAIGERRWVSVGEQGVRGLGSELPG